MSESVQYTSLGGRLMNSIKGVLAGIVFFFASFVVLFWNEGRALRTAKGLEEGQKVCVEAASDKLDSANEGKLVHLTGMAVTHEVLEDAHFGVTANALKLERSVKMYQWIQREQTKTEKQLGGGEKKITRYTYTKAWDEKWHDSSAYHDTQTPPNPPMTLTSESWIAEPVTVGAFTLPAGMVHALPARDALSVNATAASSAAKCKVYNSEYYIGANPADPQIGDVRVSFRVMKPGDVSLLARMHGSTFEPYFTTQNTTISVIKPGMLSAGLMFEQEMTANTVLTWILRLVGFMAMAMGLGLIFKPISTLGDVVPLIGSLLGAGIGAFALLVSLMLTLFTIGVAWMTYRPVLGVALLAGGVGALLLLRMRQKKKQLQPAKL